MNNQRDNGWPWVVAFVMVIVGAVGLILLLKYEADQSQISQSRGTVQAASDMSEKAILAREKARVIAQKVWTFKTYVRSSSVSLWVSLQSGEDEVHLDVNSNHGAWEQYLMFAMIKENEPIRFEHRELSYNVANLSALENEGNPAFYLRPYKP